MFTQGHQGGHLGETRICLVGEAIGPGTGFWAKAQGRSLRCAKSRVLFDARALNCCWSFCGLPSLPGITYASYHIAARC